MLHRSEQTCAEKARLRLSCRARPRKPQHVETGDPEWVPESCCRYHLDLTLTYLHGLGEGDQDGNPSSVPLSRRWGHVKRRIRFLEEENIRLFRSFTEKGITVGIPRS